MGSKWKPRQKACRRGWTKGQPDSDRFDRGDSREIDWKQIRFQDKGRRRP